jgi:hypothetical protein
MGRMRCDNPGANSSLDLQGVFGKSSDKVDTGRKNSGGDSRRSLGDSASKLDERSALAPRRPVRLLSPLKKNRHYSTPELGCMLGDFEKKQRKASMNDGWDDSENTEGSLELSNVFPEYQREQSHAPVRHGKSRSITRTNSSIDLLNVFGGSLHGLDTSLSKGSASASMSNFRATPPKITQKSQSSKKINKYSSSPNLGHNRYVSPTSVMDVNNSSDAHSTGNVIWSHQAKSGNACSERPKNVFIQGMSTNANYTRRTQLTSVHTKMIPGRTSHELLASMQSVQPQRPAAGLQKYSSTPELGGRDRNSRSRTFENGLSSHRMENAYWKPNKSNGHGNVLIKAITPPTSARPLNRGVTRTTSSLDLSLVFGSSLEHIEGRCNS